MSSNRIESPTAQFGKLALAALGLVAFGWAFAGLKPFPQGLLLGLPLLALLIEFGGPIRVKPIAFLLTEVIVFAIGYLTAGSTVLTLTDQAMRPSQERSMPIGTLLIGGALGIGLLILTTILVLKPWAQVERMRRVGLGAAFGAACISWALDRVVFN